MVEPSGPGTTSEGAKRRWIVAAAAGAALVAAALGGKVLFSRRGQEPSAEHTGTMLIEVDGRGLTPEQHAAKVRDAAEAACGAKHWKGCLAKLNYAQRMDPAGESKDPRVVALRAQANRAIESGEDNAK